MIALFAPPHAPSVRPSRFDRGAPRFISQIIHFLRTSLARPQKRFPHLTHLTLLAALLSCVSWSVAASQPTPNLSPKVSYYREIRPILQANCQGCHQPAKSKGGYIMTDFKRFLTGGDNEGVA